MQEAGLALLSAQTMNDINEGRMSENVNGVDQTKEEGSTQFDQAGLGEFRAILSDDMDWKPFSAFPPAARLAIVVGRPADRGLYLIRVRVPGDVKLMPHRHREDRIYTVISGMFYIGLGDKFDAEKLQAYPPGAVIVLPANTAHFHWARSGEYVTQVTAIGPLGMEYLMAKDDPRNDNDQSN